jgi:hypothetical protein
LYRCPNRRFQCPGWATVQGAHGRPRRGQASAPDVRGQGPSGRRLLAPRRWGNMISGREHRAGALAPFRGASKGRHFSNLLITASAGNAASTRQGQHHRRRGRRQRQAQCIIDLDLAFPMLIHDGSHTDHSDHLSYLFLSLDACEYYNIYLHFVCILRLGRVALGINEGNLACHMCLFGCGTGGDVGNLDFGWPNGPWSHCRGHFFSEDDFLR